MADNAIAGDDELLKNVKALLWGSTVKEDVFKRWAQGTGTSRQALRRLRLAELQSHVVDMSNLYVVSCRIKLLISSDNCNHFRERRPEKFTHYFFSDII